VSLTVVARDAGRAGLVRMSVVEALTRFLHPLGGGPDGQGWEFGRDVFASDVAAVVQALPGVDYVRRLQLVLQGIPATDRVPVPPDRIVVAGALDVEAGTDTPAIAVPAPASRGRR
jgi:hypothetical protein